jgi:STE24 endopeptidase
MATFDPAAATAAYLAQLPPAAHARSIAYTHASEWHLLWGWLVGLLAAWLIVRSGLLVRLRDRLERRRPRPVLTSFVVALVFIVLDTVLTLPWALYSGWWFEKSFGLNNQTWAAWLGEYGIVQGVGAVVMALFFVALYALLRRARRTWWLWGGALTALFILFQFFLVPVTLEPLLNTYKPAPQGPVRDEVVRLAAEAGVPKDKIFIYNGSKQSDRYTANVSGLGGTARVAMSDTMFKQGADIAEVRGVVGHEMGHYKRLHGLWFAAAFGVLAAVAFWLTGRLFPVFAAAMGARGVAGLADPAGLPVLYAVVLTLALLGAPVVHTISRVAESDADRFSLEHAREPDGLSKALVKTIPYRAASPGRLEEVLFYDHPSVERRVRRAMDWKAAHMPAAGTPTPTPAPAAAAPPAG